MKLKKHDNKYYTGDSLEMKIALERLLNKIKYSGLPTLQSYADSEIAKGILLNFKKANGIGFGIQIQPDKILLPKILVNELNNLWRQYK